MKLQKSFEQYCHDLDDKFLEWSHRPPYTQEDRIMRRNTWGYDMAFSFRANRCTAPGCGYPIKDADNYYVAGTGSVCDVCWAMFMAVKMRLWFVEAQREADEKKKRKPGALGV